MSYYKHGVNHHQYQDRSTMSKMQHQYWVTKEAVFRKLGKKEDENIVSSDAELDAKLELYRSIQESCADLQRIIDKYQERICILAQEENSMGRFLKEAGKHEKTGAGNVMMTLGRTLSHSGQQRISLRNPLLRLFQEVDTFRHRAIEDTARTVQAMEKARTEYRASLSWMKDVSQELDPDTYKQMEKFRKVQETVKKSKAVFDRYKLDCLQKVDLLAAARCNMFSHALILYHKVMLQSATVASEAFHLLATSCQERPKFEFNVVKELSDLKSNEPQSASQEQPSASVEADDKLLCFDDELDPNESAHAQTCDLNETSKDLLLTDEASSPTECQNQFLPSQLLLTGNLLDQIDKPELPSASSFKPNSQAVSQHEKTKSSWLELFSELDPLANPDTVGSSSSSEPLRNC